MWTVRSRRYNGGNQFFDVGKNFQVYPGIFFGAAF